MCKNISCKNIKNAEVKTEKKSTCLDHDRYDLIRQVLFLLSVFFFLLFAFCFWGFISFLVFCFFLFYSFLMLLQFLFSDSFICMKCIGLSAQG